MRDNRTTLDPDTVQTADPAGPTAVAPASVSERGLPGISLVDDRSASDPGPDPDDIVVGPVSPRTGILLALGFSLAFWCVAAWLVADWLL